MNSAYLSSRNFTDSSTRAWIVVVSGFFGCDFRIAIGLVFSPWICLTGHITSSYLMPYLGMTGTQPACRRAGATPRTFWAAESRKSGVAPARFGVFLARLFVSLNPYLALIEEIAHATG